MLGRKLLKKIAGQLFTEIDRERLIAPSSLTGLVGLPVLLSQKHPFPVVVITISLSRYVGALTLSYFFGLSQHEEGDCICLGGVQVCAFHGQQMFSCLELRPSRVTNKHNDGCRDPQHQLRHLCFLAMTDQSLTARISMRDFATSHFVAAGLHIETAGSHTQSGN